MWLAKEKLMKCGKNVRKIEKYCHKMLKMLWNVSKLSTNCRNSGKNPLVTPIYAKMGEKWGKNEQKTAILGDFGVILGIICKHLIKIDEHLDKIAQHLKTFDQNPPNCVICVWFVWYLSIFMHILMILRPKHPHLSHICMIYVQNDPLSPIFGKWVPKVIKIAHILALYREKWWNWPILSIFLTVLRPKPPTCVHICIWCDPSDT